MPDPWARRPPEQLTKRICIVDDDEWVGDSLKALLEAFGLTCSPTARDANSLRMIGAAQRVVW